MHTVLINASSERRQSKDQSVFKQALKILSNDKFQHNKDTISRVIEARDVRSTLIDWIVAFGCYEFFRYAWRKITTFEHNIDSKTKSGLTVLHYAVFLDNLEAVKVLFQELHKNDDSFLDLTLDSLREFLFRKQTPKVNIVDNNGLTAVHLAVINNNIDMLSLLLRNKAEVKVRDDIYRTPLHYTTSESAPNYYSLKTLRTSVWKPIETEMRKECLQKHLYQLSEPLV
ncbi:unnamed protein product [Mytilus coruscus]|uniref:Uncharacterized protein n=1 Tax=Mytilus coruscus TaxID=42192 RepID=A0A6J8CJ70_MYTCO|nr:unnamed protein product [Mytilus coruscus]